MRIILFALACLLLPGIASAAEPLQWVQKPALMFDATANKWHVTFELNTPSDVEVAIVDPQSSRVVRHLAAGVLGPNPPSPLVANSLSQRIEWDGRDDHRQVVPKPAALAARVRVGMSVALRRIVGGDPYGYYSPEMPHGDHSPWGINGLELKADGKVYVLGHSSTLGPPALRQYDISGNYLRTIFPPPAGKPVESMQGWGVNVKADGTYTPRFNRLTDPSLSTTFLDTTNGGMARLLPTPDAARLSFWHTGFGGGSFNLLTINTDGTIPVDPADRLSGPLVKQPPLGLGPIAPNSHIVHSLLGPVFTAPSPDGKHFYLSGLFAAQTRYGSILKIESEGFWRDGQVWKVDWETRTAKVFFALDEEAVASAARDRKSPIGGRFSYAALHGVAIDGESRVFLCDRLNKRIVVLDESGKVLREIPLLHPDAIAVSSRTGALYVTTRIGDEATGRGQVQLLKFNDWRKDDTPAVSLPVSETGYTNHHKHSYLVLCETQNATHVWVAYTEMPVRIYRDSDEGFQLLRDFREGENAQRCMGFDRIEVDQQTEEVYLLDDHSGVWKVGDWERPRFVKTPLETASIAIDARRRHIFARTLRDGSSSNSTGKIARFDLDSPELAPADFGDTKQNRLTPAFQHEWCFTGNGDKGFAIAPNGNVAVVGDPRDGLRLFHGGEQKVPWDAIKLADLPDSAGGVRFDLAGNLYVGLIDGKPGQPLVGFEEDPFARRIGKIHKYSPTGALESGNLFPTPPARPTTTYDVPFGAFDTDCIIRTPRFALDGFARIYYPTNIAQRVSIIDNAGNPILSFGTYGNRDSLGGLPGDLVPTRDIPLAFPNSVAATDRHIYVGDMVNLRLLQVEKRFALEVIALGR